MNSTNYEIIGMMSGTSLDGIDLAYCHFYKQDSTSKWGYELRSFCTYPYTQTIIGIIKLMEDPKTTFLEFKKYEILYSEYLVEIVKSFIESRNIKDIDYLSMHGHTIFHTPS